VIFSQTHLVTLFLGDIPRLPTPAKLFSEANDIVAAPTSTKEMLENTFTQT
jgi:hypothetical protein